MQEQTLPSMLHFLYRENRGQSAAMPACTLAFASLCLQNALMLLKSAEMTQVHESESVQENQAVKEEDSLGQETDASRYVGLVSHIDLVVNQLTAGSLWLSGGASVSRIQWSEVRFFMGTLILHRPKFVTRLKGICPFANTSAMILWEQFLLPSCLLPCESVQIFVFT